MLQDSFGRKFPYLRLSVTDVCNFRCTYCLPKGYQKSGARDFMTVAEIARLVRGFVELGTQKIRLTGGEPTVRRDLADIASAITDVGGIHTLALTTNGHDLQDNARRYYDAGINALNVSIDSLDAANFKAITGHDKLRCVLDGIEAAKVAGFRNIKINSVLLKGVTDTALPPFLEWIRQEPISIRFIELMRTGNNGEYFAKYHLGAEAIRQQLLARGFVEVQRQPDGGPAREFSHPDYAGRIGLIAPYAKDFCATCNRLRVTSRGQLMLCLFGEGGHDLRPYLQDDDQREALADAVTRALRLKHQSHYLHQGVTGSTPHLASLGG